MSKPTYQELADKVRELKNDSLERERIEKELLEKQAILESQNIKLVQKSIQLSDVMRELEDKNYDVELSEEELKKTMASLRDSEQKFRNFVETSPDLLFSLTRSGYIKYASFKSKELYGYDQDELIGKHLKTTTPAKDLPRAIKALKKVYAGKTLNGFNITQKNKNEDEFQA